MALADLFCDPIWQRLSWTLLHFVWQGFLVMGAVAVLGWLHPAARAESRHALALLGLAVMALCPLVTFALLPAAATRDVALAPGPGLPGPPSREFEPKAVATPAPEPPAIPDPSAPAGSLASEPHAPSPYPLSMPQGSSTEVERESWRVWLDRYGAAIQPYAVLAWLAGVLALSLRLLVSLGGIRLLLQGRRPIPQELAARVAELAQRLGLAVPLRVFLSDRVGEAVLVGIWRPMVLLPAAWLLEMTPEVLEAVIAHELAHVRRWDLWTNLLQRLVEALLFYHPAVWWLSRRMSLQREMCADNLAVAVTGGRVTYARVLELLGRRRLRLPAPQFGTAMGGTKMALLSRVRNVLGIAPAEQRLRWWPAGLVALLVPLALWAASLGAAGRPPEAKTEDPKAPGATAEKPADFTSISYSISHPLGWNMPEQIEVKADGSCVYTIEARPARGQEKERPAGRQTFNLSAANLRRLEKLLEKTDWLTAPGGEGRAMHTDAETVKLVLVRKGQTRSMTCEGRRPEPYQSLLWYFQGVARQENQLYRLLWFIDRPSVCRDLSGQVRRLWLGIGDWGYPVFEIDYTRYAPIFAGVLQNPFDKVPDEIEAAIELVHYLGMKSETKALVRLAHDRDGNIRRAVAKALVDLGGPEAVPVLAEMVASTEEARWSLVRLGDSAAATIAGMIALGDSGDDRNAEHLVRAYIDHWPELPGPIDNRIIEAARVGLQKNARGGDRTQTQYYERFLELIASDPIPLGSDLSCRLDHSWTPFCPKPMRLIHGWYVVTDGRIVEHAVAPAPEAGTRGFRIVFNASAADGRLTLKAGWQSLQLSLGAAVPPSVAQRQFDGPPGSQFEVAFQCFKQRPFASGMSPVRLTGQLRTLWEGRFVKDEQVVKRIVYAARVVAPDDPARQFAPPAEPAPPQGEPVRPRRSLTFRGLDLSDPAKLSDPAVLTDLAVAGRNHAIKAQGGEATASTQTEVVFETAPADKPGERFAVFEDRTKKVFYIQAVSRQPGPGTGIKVEYFGPFPGDPREKLSLPASKVGRSAVTVHGRVLDAEDGKPIEQFITQAGKFDPQDPSKVTWGYSEGRTTSPNPTGQFSTTIHWNEGWTARILADGYVPQPVLTQAPPPDRDQIEVVIRLQRGRLVRGRVLDHKSQPVAAAAVFAVGPTGLNLAGGHAFDSLGGSERNALRVLTDAKGRFELPVGEASKLAVSSSQLDAWPAPLPKDNAEALIRLPEPTRLQVEIQIEGSEKGDQFFYQLLSHYMDGFQGVQSTGRLPIPDSGRLELTALPPGKYQFCRYRMLNYADVGCSAMLDRQFVELKPGEKRELRFVRGNGARVRGVVTWPDDANLAGIIVSVQSVTPQAEPWSDHTFPLTHDSRLAGTRQASPSGRTFDFSSGKAEFVTERIVPGKYTIKAEGFAPLTTEQRSRTGLIGPAYIGSADILVPESGVLGNVEIRLQAR